MGEQNRGRRARRGAPTERAASGSGHGRGPTISSDGTSTTDGATSLRGGGVASDANRRQRAGIRDRVKRRIKRPIWQAVRALTGRRLQAPTHFHDVAIFGAYFNAPAHLVRRRLGTDRLLPLEHEPGVTQVLVAAMEYRSADLLWPYDEMTVAVPVIYRRGPSELEGLLHLHMPVTSEDARWSGVENYGFPKFVSEIRFDGDGRTRVAKLHTEGREVLTLSARRLLANSAVWNQRNFSVREGRLIHSDFEATGPIGYSDVACGAILELGDHPLADELRAIGVESASRRHIYMPFGRAHLGIARDLGTLDVLRGFEGTAAATEAIRDASPMSAGRAVDVRPRP